MPYFYNNIPSKTFFSALGEEILGKARTTSTSNEFRTFSKTLLNRAQNQGGNTVVLKSSF